MQPETEPLLTPPWRRWKLTLAYDGTEFKGWERQSQGERTVQGVLEDALLELTGVRVRAVGSSRTDAGVHALGHVSAVDLSPKWEGSALLRALNALTPPDLTVLAVSDAGPDFHPRHAAISKTYFYQMIQTESADPFRDRYTRRLPSLPSVEAMRRIAERLTGKRDFAALMASGSSVRTTVRHVTSIRVRAGKDWMRVFFTADGFLYKMIRNMISLMVAVAGGGISADQAEGILASGDRTRAPATFPSRGLFLWKIRYSGGK